MVKLYETEPESRLHLGETGHLKISGQIAKSKQEISASVRPGLKRVRQKVSEEDTR